MRRRNQQKHAVLNDDQVATRKHLRGLELKVMVFQSTETHFSIIRTWIFEACDDWIELSSQETINQQTEENMSIKLKKRC